MSRRAGARISAIGRLWLRKVDDERLAQLVVVALVRQQIPNVEQVARMLAVQGCHNLAGVKVRETNDLDFRKSELILYRR